MDPDAPAPSVRDAWRQSLSVARDGIAELRALDPADVYGVYRVPDRLDPKRRGGEGKAVVEWEIAHRPGAREAAETVLTSAFPRTAHVVARRPGGRRRAQRGLLRRPGDTDRRGREGRPVARQLPQEPSFGADRSRFHAAEHLVIAYRDRDEYRAGRERWSAYQSDVLRARIDRLSGARPPIAALNPRPSFLSELFDFVNPRPDADVPDDGRPARERSLA